MKTEPQDLFVQSAPAGNVAMSPLRTEPSPFPHDPDYSAERVWVRTESPEQIVVGMGLATFAVFTLLVLLFVG
jgi:hypothetical protein